MTSSRSSTTLNDCAVNGNTMIQLQNPSKTIRYHEMHKWNVLFIDREDTIAKKITGRNVIFPLLRACTHPYLLDAPRDENGEMIVNDDLITASGKFILLDKMLAKLGRTGHKVLIFSTLVLFLDLLESMCEHRNYGYTRLDGMTSFEDRIEAVRLISSLPFVAFSRLLDLEIQQRTRMFHFPDQYASRWFRIELDGSRHGDPIQFRLGKKHECDQRTFTVPIRIQWLTFKRKIVHIESDRPNRWLSIVLLFAIPLMNVFTNEPVRSRLWRNWSSTMVCLSLSRSPQDFILCFRIETRVRRLWHGEWTQRVICNGSKALRSLF